MSDWQTIGTAPKNQTEIIALMPDGEVKRVWYFAPSSRTQGWLGAGGKWVEPTHWIPLPEPPKEQT